jgi:glutathione S-transferase
MAPRLTLYYLPDACSFAVHATLRRLKIPFDAVPMARKAQPDGTSGLQAADDSFTNAEYRALHFKSKVPGLRVPVTPSGAVAAARTFAEDDVADPAPRRLSGKEAHSLDGGQVFLTELPAILDFVTGLVPEGAALAGGDPISRARVIEWTSWLVHIQSRNWSGIMAGTKEAHALAVAWTGEAHAAVDARLRALADAGAGGATTATTTTTFAVGDSLTVADIALTTWYRMSVLTQSYFGWEVKGKWPAWEAFAKGIEAAVPEVRDAVEFEGRPLL